jgi:hypothetical protein
MEGSAVPAASKIKGPGSCRSDRVWFDFTNRLAVGWRDNDGWRRDRHAASAIGRIH